MDELRGGGFAAAGGVAQLLALFLSEGDSISICHAHFSRESQAKVMRIFKCDRILDHLISALQKSAIYNRHDLTRPSMILRTDSEHLWKKVAATIAQVVTAHDFSLRREERIEPTLVKRFFSSLIFSSKVPGCFRCWSSI